VPPPRDGGGKGKKRVGAPEYKKKSARKGVKKIRGEKKEKNLTNLDASKNKKSKHCAGGKLGGKKTGTKRKRNNGNAVWFRTLEQLKERSPSSPREKKTERKPP